MPIPIVLEQPREILRHSAEERSRGSYAVVPQPGPHGLRCSSIIHHLDEFDANDLLVVQYMRASTHEQRRRSNLKNRRTLLKRTLKERGIEVVESFSEVACARFVQEEERPQLANAIECARRIKRENPHATVLVATDARNRFIRGRHYNGQLPTDPPSAGQLRRLAKLADGVVLATVLHPDAPSGEVRRYETNVPTALGQKSGKKVGRPQRRRPSDGQHAAGWKKQIRLENIDEARRLHRCGNSKRRIGRRLDVAESTIRAWLKSVHA